MESIIHIGLSKLNRHNLGSTRPDNSKTRRAKRKASSRLRRATAILMLAVCSLTAMAEVPLTVIREKADRFYSYQEWANALAMLRAIIERCPDDMQAYGRSVAVNGVINNTEEQIYLLEKTQQNGLSLDRLFQEVQTSAFEIGHPGIVEGFMILVKTRQPWLKRNINLRLAHYYNYRNNAEKMIAMSDSLLSVNPDDASMLRIKARGNMLIDNYPQAIVLYKRVIELSPDDVDAMLHIGVYFYTKFEQEKLSTTSREADEARKYLSMANHLQPTAYLQRMLDRLRLE